MKVGKKFGYSANRLFGYSVTPLPEVSHRRTIPACPDAIGDSRDRAKGEIAPLSEPKASEFPIFAPCPNKYSLLSSPIPSLAHPSRPGSATNQAMALLKID